MEAYFDDSFSGMTVSLKKLDCRTTRCLVHIETWQDPGTAHVDLDQRIRSWALDVDCGVGMLDPTEVPEAASSDEIVVFHCPDGKIPEPMNQ